MPNNNKKVPEGTISKLCVYLRKLTTLSSVDIRIISSSKLGERTNFAMPKQERVLGISVTLV